VSYAIVSNGFADGPAQALRDYLVARGADVTTVFHPLTPEQGTEHRLVAYAGGTEVDARTVRLPVRPPLSFAVDPFVPLLPPRVDAWFGFNPLACARGLVRGRRRRVVLWSVDFVPDRFGPATVTTRVYDRVDRFCCEHAEARVELTAAARDARNLRHGLSGRAAEAHVVPMGAWLDRVPRTAPDAYRGRRVVFLGHLVERQGVDTLLDAIGRCEGVGADVIGTGPLEQELRSQAHRSGVDVTFHGYVDDHRHVEGLLANAAVAVAPYAQTDETFTRYADPGKLKAYLAAGLPILLTDVPPNAHELAREGGAELVDADPAALAAALTGLLAAPDEWRARRAAALAYAGRFDWNVLLGDALAKLGLSQ
jgi:glycosyltransferase involved in cell wall biosynthesis